MPAVLPIYGELDVRSTPSGATIMIDGKDVGSTPMFFDNLLEGNHQLEVNKNGYEVYKTQVQITENQETRVACILDVQQTPKATGSAPVSSKAGRTSCEYVQLWEGGPKWATFNVGATITNYGALKVSTEATSLYNYIDKAPYYNTANVGGLYAWMQPKYNGRRSTWRSNVKTDVADVATSLWGSNWKMPTYNDLNNLKDSTYTTWTWCDGISVQFVPGCTLKGYKVSGKGQFADYSIFLPATGYYDGYEKIYDASSSGSYWSNSKSKSKFNSYYIEFYYGYFYMIGDRSYYGRSVRAVLAE